MVFERVSELIDQTAFPRVTQPGFEARKVALLRIAVGLLLCWRCAIIAWDARFYFEPTVFAGQEWVTQAIAAAVQVALALGLVFGLAPSFCALLLLLTHPMFSAWTVTYNLGPMLLVPLLGAVAVLDTGELGVRSHPRPPLPASRYRLVYFTLFLCYAALSFRSLVSYHLHDAYWIEGRTVVAMCTSSYLSVYYRLFRAWDVANPLSLWAFSALGVILQSIFQFAMIPLMFVRWGARFVRFWGWVFVLVSLAELRLSILPLVEVVLWAAIFIPAERFPLQGKPGTSPSARWRPGPTRDAPIAIYLLTYALLLLTFTIEGTFSRLAGSQPSWSRSRGALFYAGLITPNVFNQDDLKMGDHWAVIERLVGEKTELVPFDGAEGQRLSYYMSDLIYFANSLLWRRNMIGISNLAAYHEQSGKGYAYARRMALYDHRRIGATGPAQYRVTIYRNRASEFLGTQGPAKYASEQVAKFVLVVDGLKP